MTAREQRLRERIDTLTAERDQAIEAERRQRTRAERWRRACHTARLSRDVWHARYAATAPARALHRRWAA